MNWIKIMIWTTLLVIAFGFGVIYLADWVVIQKTKDRIYDNTDQIPHNCVGLLLGTGKFLSSGTINLYYQYRIEAAVALFESGKVDFILISGDNSSKNYDEPSMMKQDLIDQGIPDSKIFLDYAGFRTLDSMVRSKEIFGQESITVISQPFHNQRAIFIADWKNIEAFGFAAKDVHPKYGIKVMIREKLARIKVMLDLILRKKPKFLGEKITIE